MSRARVNTPTTGVSLSARTVDGGDMRTEPRPVTSRSAAQHDRWRPWRTRIIQDVFRVVVDATGIPVHLGHPQRPNRTEYPSADCGVGVTPQCNTPEIGLLHQVLSYAPARCALPPSLTSYLRIR